MLEHVTFPFGRLLKLSLAGLGLALATACTHAEGERLEPVYRAEPAEVQVDLYFQPGSPSLATGESAKVKRILNALVLGEDDDILVNLPATGSDVLDARRIATARSAVSGTPARIRIIRRPGFSLEQNAPDAALVQVQRYGYVRVLCPGSGLDFADSLAWNEDEIGFGCSNAINRAAMAAKTRDLTDPERLNESAAHSAIRAAEQYRAGKVETKPIIVPK